MKCPDKCVPPLVIARDVSNVVDTGQNQLVHATTATVAVAIITRYRTNMKCHNIMSNISNQYTMLRHNVKSTQNADHDIELTQKCNYIMLNQHEML